MEAATVRALESGTPAVQPTSAEVWEQSTTNARMNRWRLLERLSAEDTDLLDAIERNPEQEPDFRRILEDWTVTKARNKIRAHEARGKHLEYPVFYSEDVTLGVVLDNRREVEQFVLRMPIIIPIESADSTVDHHKQQVRYERSALTGHFQRRDVVGEFDRHDELLSRREGIAEEPSLKELWHLANGLEEAEVSEGKNVHLYSVGGETIEHPRPVSDIHW